MSPTAAALVGALFLGALRGVAAQPQGQQKPEPPKFLDDAGKDAFNDFMSEDESFSEAACGAGERLLKATRASAGKAGGQEAMQLRMSVLLSLGMCAFKKNDYTKSLKNFESALSELNMPSEDAALQNPNTAHLVMMKQATAFMTKFEATQAGTQMRRCREVLQRNVVKILKMVLKQMPEEQRPPLDMVIDELPGYGKTGNIMPRIMQNVPAIKMEVHWLQVLDVHLDQLDFKMAGIDKSMKDKRIRLGVSKGTSKGTLLYARALSTDPTAPAERLLAAEELAQGAAKALQAEAAQTAKPVSLLKRSKDGSGCKDLEKTCAELKKVADVQSNVFGETRLVVAKSGKKQALDVCSTNANVGVLLAAKDGARATVAGVDAPIQLQAGVPMIVDFCREVSVEADSTVPVLFAQAWHPEFAAVERTSEIRARSKAFGLAEDEVKAVTKVVNDFAKKSWEKSAKQWRKDSDGLAALKAAFSGEVEQKKKVEEKAAEAKRKEDEANDEDRKKALEKLEQKREAKRKAAADAAEARARRKKQLEEERENRDPWLKFPEVKSAEANLEDLKGQRREANAKLEFDLSTQLTKDISAAERALKKAIKQAKKAYKKGGAPPAEATESGAEKEAPKADPRAEELASLKKELAKVKAQKADASKNEDFKEAKRLKKEQQTLEDKIGKLEL